MPTARATILAAVLLISIDAAATARAQSNQPAPKIDMTYEAPTDPKLMPTMKELQSRRVLEQLSEFLGPLRLPHAFHLVGKQCNIVNAFYRAPNAALEVCYELIDAVSRAAPKADELKNGLTPEDVVVGQVVFALLHELGHAAFDMLQVPVFGREEDAADQMAMFLSMQFGADVERMVAVGNYYLFTGKDSGEWSDYADEHGTDSQRRYNGLCWAYGGDTALFKDYVEHGLLPKERAKSCRDEYLTIKEAFDTTVLPFIDLKAVAELQTRRWFKR